MLLLLLFSVPWLKKTNNSIALNLVQLQGLYFFGRAGDDFTNDPVGSPNGGETEEETEHRHRSKFSFLQIYIKLA